jgi:imidazole glycerol-phosphate synthase subunit HisH
MIAVIDYGAGNLRSVTNALVKLGYQPKVTKDPDEVRNATATIFPGVGAAGDAMRNLQESGLAEAILRVISQDQPLLAICVGMQVLFSATEEGGWQGCLGGDPGHGEKVALRTQGASYGLEPGEAEGRASYL